MKKADEIRLERAKLITEARSLSAKAEAEKRDMTAEEIQRFNRIMDVSLGELDQQIKIIEASETRMTALADEEKRMAESQGRRSTPAAPGGGAPEKRALRYKRPNGIERVIPIDGARSSLAYERAFYRALGIGATRGEGVEERALQADLDQSGGYLMAPQMFVAQIIAAVDNLTFVRRVANVLPPVTNAESIGAPSREADVADADWTAEIATGSEDSSLKFGKRELKPHPLAKLIKVSKTLIRKAAIDPEGIVRDRLSYKQGVTQEKAFLTGSGSEQPLGVMTASASGISTGRDVSTGNAATSIGADGLIEAKFALKVQYWTKAEWAFHRDAIKQVSKLKDGEGQYLWQMSIQAGSPDRLLGLPINISEYMPNTFTTGLYVGILGDWSHYWIADALSMSIQVLLELYAATNQNGYILRAETDGMPVLEEAFARVKLG